MLGWSKVKSLQWEIQIKLPESTHWKCTFSENHIFKKNHAVSHSHWYEIVFSCQIQAFNRFILHPATPFPCSQVFQTSKIGFEFCTLSLQVHAFIRTLDISSSKRLRVDIQVPNIDTADLWLVYLLILKCLFLYLSLIIFSHLLSFKNSYIFT